MKEPIEGTCKWEALFLKKKVPTGWNCLPSNSKWINQTCFNFSCFFTSPLAGGERHTWLLGFTKPGWTKAKPSFPSFTDCFYSYFLFLSWLKQTLTGHGTPRLKRQSIRGWQDRCERSRDWNLSHCLVMYEDHQASGLHGKLLKAPVEAFSPLWLADKHHSFLSGLLNSEAQHGRPSCFLPPS